jgi:hypothetical protein
MTTQPALLTETTPAADDVVSVYDLEYATRTFEPAAVWAKEAKNPYVEILTLIVDGRTTSPQERSVAQALLAQDSDGRWTGLPSDDRDDFAGELDSEQITRCLHMHAHTTFASRDVIASCLVVLRLMDMGLTVHIHTDWATLLVKQLMLEALDAALEPKAVRSTEVVANIHRLRAWSKSPLELDAWAAKAAKGMILNPHSVLPRRELLQALNRRDLRTRSPGFQVNYEAVLMYLTSLVSIS